MKRIRTIVCGAVTVAAITIGYLLPETVLSWKDAQISGETSTYAATPVHFFSSRQISDTLKLLSDEYNAQAILPSYASMSEDQVYKAAEEFLLQGTEKNLFELDMSSLQRYTISPSLVYVSGMNIAASEDQSTLKPLVSSRLSTIIWNCSFTDGNAVSVECTIDDATGLVASVSGWLGTSQEESAASPDKEEYLRDLSGRYAEFLKEYYDFEQSVVHYGSYPDNARISLESTDGQTIDLAFTVAGQSFSVCPEKILF